MSLAEVLPTIEELSEDDQKLLFHILAEKFVPIQQSISPQPKKIYYVYTPYNMYGAARLMREAKERKQSNEA